MRDEYAINHRKYMHACRMLDEFWVQGEVRNHYTTLFAKYWDLPWDSSELDRFGLFAAIQKRPTPNERA